MITVTFVPENPLDTIRLRKRLDSEEIIYSYSEEDFEFKFEDEEKFKPLLIGFIKDLQNELGITGNLSIH